MLLVYVPTTELNGIAKWSCWPQLHQAHLQWSSLLQGPGGGGSGDTGLCLACMPSRQPSVHPINQTLQSSVPFVHAAQHKSRVFSTRSITVPVMMRNSRDVRQSGALTNPRRALALSLGDKDSLCSGLKFLLESKITGHSRKTPADKLFYDFF